MLLEAVAYLGPARIVDAGGDRVRLALNDSAVQARLALAYPYAPAPGDVVLVIGQGEEYYVIGVLEGRGKTVFAAPADLEFRAPSGSITLAASQGVKLASSQVDVRAERWDVTAAEATETFGESYRRVQGAAQVRAGEMRQQVDGKYTVQADRIREVAEKDVHLDGERINLG